VVEGAAAVAMAGLLRLAPRLAGKNVAAAMRGNNIGADLLVETMAQHGSGSGAPGRL
jgi:threonine dehydratase